LPRRAARRKPRRRGRKAQFNAWYKQYQLSPKVTRDRLYFNTMDKVLPNIDKVIVDAPGVSLPLAERRRPPPPNPEAAPIVIEAKR
jgi:modulator of FtsH protease HflK